MGKTAGLALEGEQSVGPGMDAARKLMEELRAQLTRPETDERAILGWAAELKKLLAEVYRWAAEEAAEEEIRRTYTRLAKEEEQRIEQLRAEQQAMELALTDGLTALENRRSFDRRLRTELARVRRYGQQLSCLLIDVVNFKAVNDEWGHAAGDEVLRQMAALLSETTRGGDVPARYGGDEFAVLLPHTNLEAARLAAQRLRESVERHEFRWAGQTFRLRVSMGVGAVTPDEPTKDVLRAADEDLIRAKKSNGR